MAHAPRSTKLVYYAAHDTNLLYLAELLGLKWLAKGWQPNHTPPGGMLVVVSAKRRLWQLRGAAPWAAVWRDAAFRGGGGDAFAGGGRDIHAHVARRRTRAEETAAAASGPPARAA